MPYNEFIRNRVQKITTVNNQFPIPADTRCNCFISVSYDIQCVHELLNDDGLNIKKWRTRHFKECFYKKEYGYHLSNTDSHDSTSPDNYDVEKTIKNHRLH